jgi:hypothetical protein
MSLTDEPRCGRPSTLHDVASTSHNEEMKNLLLEENHHWDIILHPSDKNYVIILGKPATNCFPKLSACCHRISQAALQGWTGEVWLKKSELSSLFLGSHPIDFFSSPSKWRNHSGVNDRNDVIQEVEQRFWHKTRAKLPYICNDWLLVIKVKERWEKCVTTWGLCIGKS